MCLAPFLVGVVSVTITLLRVSSYWETIVTGSVVIIAVVIDAMKENSLLKEQLKRTFMRRQA